MKLSSTIYDQNPNYEVWLVNIAFKINNKYTELGNLLYKI
jgi:hypothetical protein